ncbi:PLC-like phosphodiesterase [Xylariales sp. AK1849]|nr:PLC-like phosphodiesterase [Xylariales sp. AK1849]
MRISVPITAALSWSAALAMPTSRNDGPYDSSSLAQQALQKTLGDATEIFGFPPPPSANSSSTSSRSTWMSLHPDSTLLTSLSIPGVHDAATWNYTLSTQHTLKPITDLLNITLQDPRAYRTQRSSISSALSSGVRFFDLRYAVDATFTRLVFWHHEALMSQRAGVEETLFAFWDWLDGHPSEVLFLSFQYEGSSRAGAPDDAQVQRMFFDILTSPAAREHILGDHNSIGTLGAARGKAILVRRFDMDQLPPSYEDALPGLHFPPAQWTDNAADMALVYNATTNATVFIEDQYEPAVPISANASANIAAKLGATVAHLEKAAASGEQPSSLFITFASGERLSAEMPVSPEMMAVGNGSDATPLGGVNQQLVTVLEGLRGKRLGIVILDFWDEPKDLVDLILGF